MTTEMFGTPLGFRTYDKDQADLAGMAAETEHRRGLTALNKAQADTMIRKGAREDRLYEALGRVGAGGQAAGPSGVDGLEADLDAMRQKARIFADVGEVEKATTMLQHIASATNSVAGARSSEALAKGRTIDQELKQLRRVQELFSGVSTPQQHAEAVMALQASPDLAGLKLPQALTTYNPNAIKAFLTGSPAQIARRELQLKEIDAARKAGDSASLRATRGAQVEVARRKADAYIARQEAVTKAGGGEAVKSVGTPNGGEFKAAKALLKQQGIEFDSAEEADAAAQTIAEQGRVLWRSNPGISPDVARARVLEESKTRGEFPEAGNLFNSKKVFKPQLGSVSRPLPAETNISKLKPNTYYQDTDGTIIKFLGSNGGKPRYEVVRKPSAVPQIVGGDLAEEEDE